MLVLRDIRKTYQMGDIEVPVLKGVSFAIETGDMVALVGASGSGKSTLMNVLGCLDRPTTGSYQLDGREVARLSLAERAAVRRDTIGFVFQNFNLLARTSALENVMMPLTYATRAPGEAAMRRRAAELLERVGLGDRMDHHPSQLSGGQQQRVAIARALVNHPRVLLADEPTGNLDSHTSGEILAMFQELHRRDGITIVLVTHEKDVADHARRTIRMRDGLIEEGGLA